MINVENLDSIEEALERAAHIHRIALLMHKGLNQPETELDDHQDMLAHLLWASGYCLGQAIELHNAKVPKPEDQPGVMRLRPKDGAS